MLAVDGWEAFVLGRAETRIHYEKPGVRGYHLGPRAWEPYWVIRRKGHPGARSKEEWDLRFAQLLHSVKKEQDKNDEAKEGLRKEASDWGERFTDHPRRMGVSTIGRRNIASTAVGSALKNPKVFLSVPSGHQSSRNS